MEDNGSEERKDIQLIITISSETGQLSLAGPGEDGLYDEPMCFWMLEKAKDYIKMNNVNAMHKKKPSGIVVPGKQPFYRDVFGKKG